MTTAALFPRPGLSAAPALARIGSVIRLHFANPMTVVLMPLFILGVILVLNLLIWALIVAALPPDAQSAGDGFAQGTQWSGATSFVFVWQMIMAIQAMNATFPYALGFGVTRRDYYLGTALAWILAAAAWSILFTVLAAIETATGGWGLGGRMFTAIYFGADGLGMLPVYVFLLFLLFLFLGTLSGAMYVRFRAFGVTFLWVGLAFLLVGGLALVIVTDGIEALGSLVTSLGFGGVYALTLIPTVLAAVAGFFVLRRATPRG